MRAEAATVASAYTYGRFNDLEGNLYVSGPLSDTIKARIAFTGARADDWQKSYTRADTLGKLGYYGGRAIVDWTPSSRLDFELTFNAWRDQSDPQAPQYQTLLSQYSPGTDPALVAYPFAPFNARAADWTPSTRPHGDHKFYQGALRANWKVADGITLTSITSYVDYRTNQGLESDGTSLSLDDFIVDRGYIKSFNQELRLADDGGSPLRWVVGANYEKSHVYQYELEKFGTLSTVPLYGYTGSDNYSDQHMRNYAFFGNLEYDLSSQFTVKGGVRYTNARRSASTCTGDPGDGSFSSAFDYLINSIQSGAYPVAGFTPTGVTVPPIGTGCAPFDNTTLDGTPATYLPGEYHGLLKEHNISWRAGIDYKPTSNLLLYVNAARGYKAGSFPIASAATFQQFLPVKQESLLSFETGFKFHTLDRVLQVTGAAFYYDYENKQLRGKIVDPIFGILDALTNVPKSRMFGLEMDATLTPFTGFSISASGSFLDSKITKFSGPNTAGVETDYAGSVIPYTPKYQVRIGADYSWKMGSVSPFVGIVFSARSKALANIGGSRALVLTPDFASSVDPSHTYTIDGYSTVDARIGASFDDGKYTVTVFGKNIFNRYYVTNIFTDYDTISRFAGQPATYGITLAAKFK
ncbi:TonB-dependent receptor [Sphingobium sp. H39-3-25]|uniref:TonB-dependent receptor n=1 Tax=Sphingobium arseniciresistens TaxID=3030834 RepID=UPI0023B92212|nr:TonB-dependent receptor [Sphingobium arseniciresistens]